MNCTVLPKMVYFTLTAGFMVASQSAVAHNSFTSAVVNEGTRVYNNMVIGKGCGHESPKLPVIATSIVFPDGTDSIIKIGGEVQEGAVVDDYIDWGGKISHIPSKDIFQKQVINFGRAGLEGNNVVGSWSWKGKLPGDGAVGQVPFRVKEAFINEESCATTVKFRVAVADICKFVTEKNLSEENVNLWVPAVGSKFDGDSTTHAYDGAVEYVITRDTNEHPLPQNCGDQGVEVVIEPSAAQINHDLPIPRVWPK